jgi:hypothetical protein
LRFLPNAATAQILVQPQKRAFSRTLLNLLQGESAKDAEDKQRIGNAKKDSSPEKKPR